MPARIDGEIIPRKAARTKLQNHRQIRRSNAGEPQATRLLHEEFEVQATASPEAVAVLMGDEPTTYGELNRRANRLARHMRTRGVRPKSPVALLMPRSADAYAALLGILKAGACYVPLDPDYPADRVAYILRDSGAEALVTTANLAERHPSFAGPIIRIDADRRVIDGESPVPLSRNEAGTTPTDLCYIIYTSGSTGRPKGVMIEHRSARHLVRAERLIYGVNAEDRVYQGASLAFDLSVEEIWMAFSAGATLVAATPEMAHAGPDLAQCLVTAGVTVLSCVPTLLAMMTEDAPTLRLLILGGESCPEEIVRRWTRPGRRIINTYGPTETTVIATYAELLPDRPVTIGRAVPGYRVRLLDDQLRPVRHGVTGEICIAGIGVARGYVGLPEETQASFLPDSSAGGEARMYRTGDLGRLNDDGNLEFRGRRDGQVKVRGYRVELAEIEAALLQSDGVRAAAAALRKDHSGAQRLVGYVVPVNGTVDEERIQALLRQRLPTYMVPALIETIGALPLLPNGKLDREALPAPGARTAEQPRSLTATERRIADVWEALFDPQPVSIDADFFLDLGGHSLLAARMVSALRKDARFASVSMADVYDHPTVASLAVALDARAVEGELDRNAPTAAVYDRITAPTKDVRVRHFLSGVVQSACLYLVFGFGAARWTTPYLVYFLMQVQGRSALESAEWAAAITALIFPAMFLVAIGSKWLLLGRIRPGRHRLWGGYHLRWWLVQNLIETAHMDQLEGTPLLPVFYRLLGVRIGRNVHLETRDLAAFDLISIGDGTTVDEHASLLGYTVEGSELIIGPIHIGRGCFVGTHAVLREETVMEDGARIEDQSLLLRGTRIPAGETWAGSPARRAAGPAAAPTPPMYGAFRRAAILVGYSAFALVFPLLVLAAFVPGVAVLEGIDFYVHPLRYFAAVPLVGASFVLTLTAGTVLLKWLLLGRVRAGTYPVHGSFYIRKWIVDRLLSASLEVAGALHATLYLAPWHRALGARLGRFVELSTATSMTQDLLEIDDGGTIADEASLGAGRVEAGWLTLLPTRLGQRAFVGNGAVVPQGTMMGDNSLVGVLSIAPLHPDEAARPGASWFGSPPIALPRRQASRHFPEQTTYAPTRALRLKRGAFELLRVTLPSAGFIVVMTTLLEVLIALRQQAGLAAAILLLPFVYEACCIVLALAVAAAKWAIMGRFRPFEHPQWSWYVWKLELVNALYEFMLSPLALDSLQGTPFLPWYFRLLGARIGRRTYCCTTGLIEFDLVEVADESVLNHDCVLQSHLFEDRILKASLLRIGRRCTVGVGSVVLYDTHMEDGARLDGLSLLMKGETLPAGTAWAGIPARTS